MADVVENIGNEGGIWMSVVRVKKHNQITISKKLRDKLGIKEGDYIEVEFKDGGLFIKPKETEVQPLLQIYKVRDQSKVGQFLEAHSFLIPALKVLHSKVRYYFGGQTTTMLEVIVDPEAMDDTQLFAFIQTHLLPDEAHDRLEQLDEQWWLDEMDKTRGKLSIHLEFV